MTKVTTWGVRGAAFALALTAWGAAASAQTCTDYIAEGAGANREGAMRSAYAAILRSADPGMAQIWTARNMRIGEAPGYVVQKLGSRCSASGAGQTCRIEATLCR